MPKRPEKREIEDKRPKKNEHAREGRGRNLKCLNHFHIFHRWIEKEIHMKAGKKKRKTSKEEQMGLDLTKNQDLKIWVWEKYWFIIFWYQDICTEKYSIRGRLISVRYGYPSPWDPKTYPPSWRLQTPPPPLAAEGGRENFWVVFPNPTPLIPFIGSPPNRVPPIPQNN